MRTKVGFAFGKSDLENQLTVPLRAAFRHYCMTQFCLQQETTYKYYDHWRAEVLNLTDSFLDAVILPSTLQPAGRIKVYLRVVAAIKSKNEAWQEAALDHYLASFPDQEGKLKSRLLPEAKINSFWESIHRQVKKRLIAHSLVGKIWTFEQVFGPIGK